MGEVCEGGNLVMVSTPASQLQCRPGFVSGFQSTVSYETVTDSRKGLIQGKILVDFVFFWRLYVEF